MRIQEAQKHTDPEHCFSVHKARYCVLYTVDCSAIVEHTKRVIYLEDDDVAAVADGNLTIHRYEYIYTVKKDNDFPVPSRDVNNQIIPAGNNLIIPAGNNLIIPAGNNLIIPGQGEFDY